MKRKWIQWPVMVMGVEDRCQRCTDNGWTIFTILPLREVRDSDGTRGEGALIVAFMDDADKLSGVPR